MIIENNTKLIQKLIRNISLMFLLLIFSVALLQAQEVEEVVVQGTFIPDEKRDTSEISAILDSSEIERTGDDNIAVALTRLTGLSLVRGKYVYVRCSISLSLNITSLSNTLFMIP